MQGLFSHAAAPEPDRDSAGDAEPLHFTVRVPVGVDEAFEGFTEYIHLWWPVSEHSRFGESAHMSLDVDGLSEESPTGQSCRWATLLEARAPERIELRCTYDFEELPPSRVVVTFEDDEGGTRVDLDHDDLAPGADGRRQAQAYASWDPILDRFVRFMGGQAAS